MLQKRSQNCWSWSDSQAVMSVDESEKQDAVRAIIAPEYLTLGWNTCWWSTNKKKKQNCWEMLSTCLLSIVSLNSIQWLQYRSQMARPISGWGGHLCFPVGPKDKLGRGRWDLASQKVSLNSIQQRSRKCLGQSEAMTAILLFWSARQHKISSDFEILLEASCQFSLNSIHQLQGRSRKLLGKSEATAAFFVFRSAWKKTL